jgi:hypothetical protein
MVKACVATTALIVAIALAIALPFAVIKSEAEANQNNSVIPVTCNCTVLYHQVEPVYQYGNTPNVLVTELYNCSGDTLVHVQKTLLSKLEEVRGECEGFSHTLGYYGEDKELRLTPVANSAKKSVIAISIVLAIACVVAIAIYSYMCGETPMSAPPQNVELMDETRREAIRVNRELRALLAASSTVNQELRARITRLTAELADSRRMIESLRAPPSYAQDNGTSDSVACAPDAPPV